MIQPREWAYPESKPAFEDRMMKRGVWAALAAGVVLVMVLAGFVAVQMTNAYRWGYQRDQAVAVLVEACPAAMRESACAMWAADTVDHGMARTDAILACAPFSLADCLTKAGIAVPKP